MKADPRGAVDPSEVIGREATIERLWSTLPTRGVLLQGRLGVGKTTVVRSAFADAPTTWRGVVVPLADVRGGTAALTRALLGALWAEHVGPGPALKALLEPRAHGRKGEVELAVGDHEATELLRSALRAELSDQPTNLVVALDDLDRFVAANLEKGVDLAELLVTFDELQHELPRLRWLLTSNVRLARLLAHARPRVSASMIDALEQVTLESLSPESGARLAVALLLGESVTARDRAALARKLAERFDHVPKWIHAALQELARRRAPVSEADLEPLLAKASADPKDPWRLRAELQPVLEGYPVPTRGIALAILDQLAQAEEGSLTFGELRSNLAIEMTLDEDAIRRVLGELRADQVCEEVGGRLRFCGECLRRCWVGVRGLGG